MMKQVPESLVPGRHSLDRRAFVQLAATFGLSLTVPGLAAKPASVSLTADEWTLIGEVSELIIPATETGGALAAGVPGFVKMMLSDWFSQTERENFIAGMHEFSAGAVKKHGRKFAELTASQKDLYFSELLATAEGGATAPRTPFVVLMKRLTIFGYYTSELGATSELRQQMAAAKYEPAAVVKPGDRADSGLPGAMYWFNAS
jgi:glucoside 3-dehydrogenase (cytochrome c) hitch-hiker subunit